MGERWTIWRWADETDPEWVVENDPAELAKSRAIAPIEVVEVVPASRIEELDEAFRAAKRAGYFAQGEAEKYRQRAESAEAKCERLEAERLTPEEAKAVKVALIFGDPAPDDPHEPLERAKAKLAILYTSPSTCPECGMTVEEGADYQSKAPSHNWCTHPFHKVLSAPLLSSPKTECPTCGSDEPAWTAFDGDKLLWTRDDDYAFCPDPFHSPKTEGER